MECAYWESQVCAHIRHTDVVVCSVVLFLLLLRKASIAT